MVCSKTELRKTFVFGQFQPLLENCNFSGWSIYAYTVTIYSVSVTTFDPSEIVLKNHVKYARSAFPANTAAESETYRLLQEGMGASLPEVW